LLDHRERSNGGVRRDDFLTRYPNAAARAVERESMIATLDSLRHAGTLGKRKIPVTAPVFQRENGAICRSAKHERVSKDCSGQRSAAEFVAPRCDIPSILQVHFWNEPFARSLR